MNQEIARVGLSQLEPDSRPSLGHREALALVGRLLVQGGRESRIGGLLGGEHVGNGQSGVVGRVVRRLVAHVQPADALETRLAEGIEGRLKRSRDRIPVTIQLESGVAPAEYGGEARDASGSPPAPV